MSKNREEILLARRRTAQIVGASRRTDPLRSLAADSVRKLTPAQAEWKAKKAARVERLRTLNAAATADLNAAAKPLLAALLSAPGDDSLRALVAECMKVGSDRRGA